MLRKLSSIAVKGMIPIRTKSMTLRPTIPAYDCNRMRPMILQNSLYSNELHSKSMKPICNEAPVGINGMNSLAKLITWNSFGEDGVNIVAINQPCTNVHSIAQSLKFDSIYGKFSKNVEVCGDCIYIHDRLVKVTHEKCPENIKWEGLVEYVLETSGKVIRGESAKKHIEAGAKKVIIAGPSMDAPMFVKGMNFEKYNSCMQVVSNASSSTHCAGPLIKVLHDKFGVDSVMINSTHAQRVIDEDELDEEIIMDRIIPKSTGAVVTLGKILPELQGRVMGLSGRFPVSYLELQLFISKDNVTLQEIKDEIMLRGECELKGILNGIDKCVDEKKFIGCRYSGIVDFNNIHIIDKYVTIGMWYDNEMGYANRVLDLTKHMMAVDRKNKINP